MILGIAGTLGAGKGTVVKYLVEQHAFKHFSVRDFLWEEVDKRGLPRVRDNLSLVANDLRAKYGAGHIVEQLFEQAKQEGGNVVIESLHTPGEAEFLKKHGAFILGVNADFAIRYGRIAKRGTETDGVTLEKFKEDNDREIRSADASKHNIAAVIEMADFRLENSGTVEELHKAIDSFFTQSF